MYFGLYVVFTQMLGTIIVIPGDWEMPEIETLPPFRNVISWTALHVFGVTRPLVITGSGSGDKTFDWVAAFCLLVAAILATALWSVTIGSARTTSPHTSGSASSSAWPPLRRW